MLNKKIRVLNFDDSVTGQKGLLSRYDAEVVDLTDLGPSGRFWADRGVRREIGNRIPEQGAGHVTFLGSGDFHHITEILLSRYDEPVSLIDFDFHQDWDGTSSLLHCGSWVTRALNRENILKCVILGASSKEMDFFSLQAGCLERLKDDRIELYPYSSKPGAVFFRRVPRNISFAAKRYPFFTGIGWNELKNKNITEFFMHIIRRLPSKKVYITVDKDCMNTGDALTNWDQGKMPLDHLLEMLKMIKDNCEIVGMDMTGDYSPVRADGVFKNAMLWLSHPKNIEASKFSGDHINKLNEATNLKILDLVTS